MGQLVGGVAHDFNNLLTLIVGHVEYLAEVDDEEERDQLVEDISQACMRGGHLTQKLLTFARRQVLSAETIHLNTALADTVDLLTRALGEEHPLRVDGSAPTLLIRCDPGELEAALVNLVLNARDASRAGDPISLRVHQTETSEEVPCGPGALAAGRYAVIEVSDRGVGLPPEAAERVWEPFVSTKSDGAHSGLGLSMVLGFAQQAGGGVEFQTRPAVDGTVFSLYLPLCEATDD